MEYTDYIKSWQDRKEREAQLITKYSDKPEHAPVRSLRLMNSMEKHVNHNAEYTGKALLAVFIMAVIVIAYCILA